LHIMSYSWRCFSKTTNYFFSHQSSYSWLIASKTPDRVYRNLARNTYSTSVEAFWFWFSFIHCQTHFYKRYKHSSMCEFWLTSQIPLKICVVTSILHSALNLNRILQFQLTLI